MRVLTPSQLRSHSIIVPEDLQSGRPASGPGRGCAPARPALHVWNPLLLTTPPRPCILSAFFERLFTVYGRATWTRDAGRAGAHPYHVTRAPTPQSATRSKLDLFLNVFLRPVSPGLFAPSALRQTWADHVPLTLLAAAPSLLVHRDFGDR
jgi:hypothetical protein